MKKKIFESYLKEVCRQSGLSEEELLTKNKQTKYTRPRQMLIYLCLRHSNMSVKEVVEHLADHGFSIPHSTINYSRSKFEHLLTEDSTLYVITKQIANSVIVE